MSNLEVVRWTYLTHNRRMLTRDKLAEMLDGVNVEDVAREARVSTKTIYRLRHKKHAPTLDTVAAIVDAVKRIQRAARPKAA